MRARMHAHLTPAAYHNDVAVGGIAARCEKAPGGGARAYIATLCVLAPYRGYGIGAWALGLHEMEQT